MALHKAIIDDICGMAQTLAANCNVEMLTVEASQVAAHFHALTSDVQVPSLIVHRVMVASVP